MHSIVKIFWCLLLLNFDGFISLGPNFVSTRESKIPVIEDGPIISDEQKQDYNTNWLAKPIRAAIEATSKFGFYKPLTLFAGADETSLLNQSIHSLDVGILNPVTVAVLTGGALGNEVYVLNTYHYYWNDETESLATRCYYRNAKYENYEKAQDYPDGIVILIHPVSIKGDVPSSKFDQFSKIVKKKISKPGDSTEIPSSFTFSWFVNYPLLTYYNSYKREFIYGPTGKKYTAHVIRLPLLPRFNFISNEQYKSTFSRIRKVSEDTADYELLDDIPYWKTKVHVGLWTIILPA